LQEQGRAARASAGSTCTRAWPCGHGERIFAGRDDAAALARARAWWGAEVTSIYDGSSSSALLQGLMWNAIYDACPAARLHRHRAGIWHLAAGRDDRCAARRSLA